MPRYLWDTERPDLPDLVLEADPEPDSGLDQVLTESKPAG